MTVRPVANLHASSFRWRRFSNYHFATKTTVAPLAAAEVPKASSVFPLAFTTQDNEWSLSALLSILPDQNVFVGEDGKWIARYVPAAFRAHPFCVGWNNAGEPGLCVDESSGLITEDPSDEAFFDPQGELTPLVAQVWAMLQEASRSELVLGQACKQLHACGLLEPWTIKIENQQGNHRVLSGIHRINEHVLAKLGDEDFLQLRRSGALSVAYAQLLSMANLETLVQLARTRLQFEDRHLASEQASKSAQPLINLPDDSTIDWDWSKVGKS